MKFPRITGFILLVLPVGSLPAQDGVDVRVGSQIGVDTTEDQVRIQLGPLRIRVGEDGTTRKSEQSIARFLSDRQLMAAPVFGGQGRPLGRVEDIVIDTRNGGVKYIAVAFPDTDEGKKLFAIPLGSMQLYHMGNKLQWQVDIERSKLEAAPGFSRSQWPNIANRQWAERIDVYYGVIIRRGDFRTDFGTDVKPLSKVVPLQRSSRILRAHARDSSGNNLGTVRRLILDRTSGQVRYLAIRDQRSKASKAVADKTTLVPITKVKFIPGDEQDSVVLSMKSSKLQQAPYVKLSDVTKPGYPTEWTKGVDAFFNVKPNDAASRLSKSE